LFRRGNALWAAPLANDWSSITREPFPVVENVGSPYDYFSVSAEGTLFHVDGGASMGAGAELAIVDTLGNVDVLPLSPRAFSAAQGPAWSPDGESVVFESGEQIYTYNTVLNTTPRQLTFEGANFFPVYSPDGTRVAFQSIREGADGYDLFVKDLTDDAPPRSLLAMEGIQQPMGWPFDSVLVFLNDAPRSGRDLWMLDLSDPEEPAARPYLTSEADLRAMSVSSDGRYAAYESNEGGQIGVYARSFPEPGGQTGVTPGQPGLPYWSSDGLSIYTIAGPGLPTSAARLQRDPVLSVIGVDTVFRAPQLSAPPAPTSFHAPTGRWIMALDPGVGSDDDGPRVRLVLVQNFHEELRRLSGGD
jgi:hypothetical protein